MEIGQDFLGTKVLVLLPGNKHNTGKCKNEAEKGMDT